MSVMRKAPEMKEPTIIHSTFALERSFPKPPEQVFAAFADVEKKRRWYAVGDRHQVEAFEMDFRVGGAETFLYRMGKETPFPGTLLENHGTYQEIVTNRSIVLATTMSLGGKRISSSLITVELLWDGTATDLIFTHQGAFYEGSGGPEMREAGWKTILDRLANVI